VIIRKNEPRIRRWPKPTGSDTSKNQSTNDKRGGARKR